jgi:hypothetical protein
VDGYYLDGLLRLVEALLDGSPGNYWAALELCGQLERNSHDGQGPDSQPGNLSAAAEPGAQPGNWAAEQPELDNVPSGSGSAAPERELQLESED